MPRNHILVASLLLALALVLVPVSNWIIALLLLAAIGLVLWDSRAKTRDRYCQLAATVFETSSNGIMITDLHNTVLAINTAFTTITGFTPEDAIGKNPKMLSSGRHDQAFYQKLWHALDTEGMWQGEIWNRNKQGEIYAEWLTINAAKNAQGNVTHHIAIFSDITERKKQAERVEYLATHDGLTGLPNRVMFSELLIKALADARRSRTKMAMLFLDLDKFKLVNDTLGHDVGDLLLQYVATTLLSLLRAGDVVARQGGDEFTMALPNLASTEDAIQLANKILRSLEQPCTLKGYKLQVTISIGISLFPDDGADVSGLLKAADVALYRAKQAGRNNFQLYDAVLMASEAGTGKR